jgi:tetratricopeptide (TPR) repeat protein
VQRRDGSYEEALAVLDQGLVAAEPYVTDLRPLLLERARTLEVLGRLEEARTATEEGLANLPSGAPPDTTHARLLVQRAGMHIAARRLDEAKADLRTALAIFSDHDDPVGLIGSLIFLGEAHSLAGAHAEATDTYQRALAEAVRIGRVEDAAGVLNNMGLLALATEDWNAARDAFAAATEQFAQVGHRAGLATCRANEAYALWKLGDLEAARALADQAAVEADAIGRAFQSADARLTAALVARSAGDIDDARRLAEQALTVATDGGEDDLAGQARDLLTELGASPLR